MVLDDDGFATFSILELSASLNEKADATPVGFNVAGLVQSLYYGRIGSYISVSVPRTYSLV